VTGSDGVDLAAEALSGPAGAAGARRAGAP
jgi:hypothetical protein